MAITANTMTVLENYRNISSAIAAVSRDVTLVAVSKTYDADHIRPVLEAGHRVFGENRVQEAKQKWPALRQAYPGLELHLIGPLQSNKAAEAVALFDVIQTVDRPKIAEAIAREMQRQSKPVRLYVQVNTGREPQKAGVLPEDLAAILTIIRNSLSLTVEGLMCIPPADEPPAPHFVMLRTMAAEHGIAKLSMGMSGDFAEAITQSATHVRVGSAIFGGRDYNTP
jgi:PLP dependent protein